MTAIKRSLGCWRFSVVALMLVAGLAYRAVANSVPSADFSALLTAEGATSVWFDAAASSDADGTIVAYQWLFGDGTTGSGPQKSHTYPTLGVFEVTLLVFDSNGASSLTTRAVDIAALPLRGPAAPAAGGEVLAQPVATPADAPVGNRVGQLAPAFALPDFDDTIVRLRDFLGRPVLLEFWKSTCPGCVASTPRLEAVRQAYEQRGLVVLLIILDQNAIQGYNFLIQNGYTEFVTVREIHPVSKETMFAYGVSYTPHAFLIDRRGVIQYSGHPNSLADAMIAATL